MNTSLIFVMVAIAIGGVAWVFIYPLLSGERNAERRMASVTRKEPMQQRTPRAGQKSRREQVEGSPKQLKARQKASKAAAGAEILPSRLAISSTRVVGRLFLSYDHGSGSRMPWLDYGPRCY
jgi:tight adherence protein B